MAHNNRLSRRDEQAWVESLGNVAQDRADAHPPTDSLTPSSLPWPTELDDEYLDELVEQGRR